MSDPSATLDAILQEAETALGEAPNLQALAEVRAAFLGKKGSVSGVLRGIGGLEGAERAAVGQAANQAKVRIEQWASDRKAALEQEAQGRSLTEHQLDVTLPGVAPPRGHLHPVSLVEEDMCAFFRTLGYSVADGPEVETDWNNFGALNFPEDHPARDMQDTIFVEGGNVLRTHTSNVQIRAMTGRKPPFRVIAPGRVYRHDLDATHYPMFHQIEGFCVGERVTFGDLKGTLYAFARHLFGSDVELRFRAHFFPFTEPSAEMDVSWGEGWLEWGGCGMVHPRVLLNCGIDPERYQGFAFGMALDRGAMLQFGIPNIQLLFDGDVRVLEQFSLKVPLGWLSEWVDLPARDALCDRLTSAGLEIEEIIETGPDLSAVRVGAVAEREPHPNADRLSLCKVDLGEGELLDIVCGAPNVAQGQKVAVATHGAVLPGDFKIKRSKIRGVTSNGMICSTRELGLGEEHEGILVLPADAPVGAPLTDVLPSGETVLDLEITPNRGDWVSMLGMAREVRANFGGELRLPESAPAEAARAASDDVAIEVVDREGCPRYVARIVRGVTIGPSPDWLVQRLEAAGLRSVCNVVDVTNLVMLELGQPLHAFDLDRIEGGTVSVRAAEAGEKIVTLDGQSRELRREDLVIADGSGAIAIAGVMGGAETEVGEGTANLLIESAHFHRSRVRRTARRLGLHSDASYRFERGVDPDGQQRAADRAARLIQELAGGEVSQGSVEAVGAAWPTPAPIELEVDRVNRLLGTALGVAEVVSLLARVDVKATERGDALHCEPPAYRSDLHLPVDLIEEVARIHGYDDIPPTLPLEGLGEITEPPRRATTQAVRRGLVGAGLVEVMTFPAAPTSDAEALGLAADDPRSDAVGILNPIQSHEASLRTQLVASVLRVVRSNLAKQSTSLRLFELSRVFRKASDGGLPDEPIEAVAALSLGGDGDLWDKGGTPVFFHAKGVAERLLSVLERPAEFRADCAEPFLHPGARGSFAVGGRAVISVGELHPEVAARFEIDAPVALVVVDVDALDAVASRTPRYEAVSKHPRVRRDLAVLLERSVPAGEVLEAIRKKAGSSLASVQVFDRYEGKGVPDGKVSVAFRLVFQRLDRTLTEAEVAKSIDRVVQLVSKRFGGELR